MSAQVYGSGGVFFLPKPSYRIKKPPPIIGPQRPAVYLSSDGNLMGGVVMSKSILLTQGKLTTVDDGDLEWLNQWKWYYVRDGRTGYAIRSQWDKVSQTRRHVQMAPAIMRRLLAECSGEVVVDHINGDGLDNRRCNLRICTRAQNAANRRKQKGCSSKYKGVTWLPDKGKWQAYIKTGGRSYHLGHFDNEKAAARAYDRAALLRFGQYAKVNGV